MTMFQTQQLPVSATPLVCTMGGTGPDVDPLHSIHLTSLSSSQPPSPTCNSVSILTKLSSSSRFNSCCRFPGNLCFLSFPQIPPTQSQVRCTTLWFWTPCTYLQCNGSQRTPSPHLPSYHLPSRSSTTVQPALGSHRPRSVSLAPSKLWDLEQVIYP